MVLLLLEYEEVLKKRQVKVLDIPLGIVYDNTGG